MEVATTAQSGTIVAKDTSRSSPPMVRSYRRFLPSLLSSTLQMWRYVFIPTKLLPPDVGGLILSRDEIDGLNMLTMINEKHSFWKTNLIAAVPFTVLSILSVSLTLFSTNKYLSIAGTVVSCLFIISAFISTFIQEDTNNDTITNAWPNKLRRALGILYARGIKVPNILHDFSIVSVPGSETIDIVAFRKLGARDTLAMMRLADMLLSRSDSIDILTVDGETSELLSRVHSAIENSLITDLRLSVMDGL